MLADVASTLISHIRFRPDIEAGVGGVLFLADAERLFSASSVFQACVALNA